MDKTKMKLMQIYRRKSLSIIKQWVLKVNYKKVIN